MNIGAHMSIAGGVHLALERGRALGCGAVQLFVKNTTQWRARTLDRDEVAAFRRARDLFPPNFVLAHASYLVNLASRERRILGKSLRGFREEMEGARLLGIPYMVLHPGSHRGAGVARGIARLAASLDEVFSGLSGAGPSILLETTAGQGDSLGGSFDELARIIDRSRFPDSLGVCLDTCHVFAAGYDLRTAEAYDRTFEELDRVLGLDRLKAFHLNDSMRELGSRVDRHTHIGKGTIGLAAFALLVNDGRFLDRPMVLETPKGASDANDRRNLRVLRGLRRPVSARAPRRASSRDRSRGARAPSRARRSRS